MLAASFANGKMKSSSCWGVQDYKALVESFSEAHGLPAPGTRSCRRQAPNYIGSPEEALFLDFFTALVVRFPARLWIPQTRPIRPGAQKFLVNGQRRKSDNSPTCSTEEPCSNGRILANMRSSFSYTCCMSYTCKHSGLFKLRRTQVQVYSQAVPSGRDLELAHSWHSLTSASLRQSKLSVVCLSERDSFRGSENPIWLQCSNVATILQLKVDSVTNLKFLYPRALRALKPPELEALAFTAQQDWQDASCRRPENSLACISVTCAFVCFLLLKILRTQNERRLKQLPLLAVNRSECRTHCVSSTKVCSRGPAILSCKWQCCNTCGRHMHVFRAWWKLQQDPARFLFVLSAGKIVNRFVYIRLGHAA